MGHVPQLLNSIEVACLSAPRYAPEAPASLTELFLGRELGELACLQAPAELAYGLGQLGEIHRGDTTLLPELIFGIPELGDQGHEPQECFG